jgi:hypothetical protein
LEGGAPTESDMLGDFESEDDDYEEEVDFDSLNADEINSLEKDLARYKVDADKLGDVNSDIDAEISLDDHSAMADYELDLDDDD